MKNFVLVFMLVITTLINTPSYAKEETPKLAVNKPYLYDLISEKKCTEYWGALWPLAKAGNYEARAMLFSLMAPPPGMKILHAPGSSNDLVTKMRNIVIMAAHSHDYNDNVPIREEYRDASYEIYKMAGLENGLSGRKFMECAQNREATNCVEIAVRGRLIPSFEDYAKQIDMFMESGMKSTCR